MRAYAHDLRDWFEFLDGAGVSWSAVRLEDVGRFVAWLRLPPMARDGREVVGALPSTEGFLRRGDGEPEAVGGVGVL